MRPPSPADRARSAHRRQRLARRVMPCWCEGMWCSPTDLPAFRCEPVSNHPGDMTMLEKLIEAILGLTAALTANTAALGKAPKAAAKDKAADPSAAASTAAAATASTTTATAATSSVAAT